MTLAELQAKIAQHAWEDPAFEAEFMADPKAAFEKYTGRSIPADVQIHAHYNTPSELHFVLPKRTSDAGELTDEDLERVAGGEVAVVTLAATVVASLLSLSAIGTVVKVGLDEGW